LNSFLSILPSPFESIYMKACLNSSKYFSGSLEARKIKVAFLKLTASIKCFIFSKASSASYWFGTSYIFLIQGWSKASSAENLLSTSLTSKCEIKSFAWSETDLNESYSKVYYAFRTFSMISLLDSPGKGTLPDSII
jgi:hypothetical protein